jgi:hypothetical protein
MFTKDFDRRLRLVVAVLAGTGALGVSFGVYALWPSNLEAGYAPLQPIPFSHLTHAGTLQIDCLYCHTEAEKGPHATVPEVAVCMNCHTQVKPVDARGKPKPGVAEILGHWERREPVRWVKVSDLADFVYFDHGRHLAGGVACRECHGPVEKMERVRREYGLKMSWCLACHRQPPLPGRAAPPAEPGHRAPTHCTTCHR